MLDFHPYALEAHDPLGVGMPLQIDRLIALRFQRMVLLHISGAFRAEGIVELALVQIPWMAAKLGAGRSLAD